MISLMANYVCKHKSLSAPSRHGGLRQTQGCESNPLVASCVIFLEKCLYLEMAMCVCVRGRGSDGGTKRRGQVFGWGGC